MAVIAIAVFDTKENGRTELTKQTLHYLRATTDLSKHRLIIVDNNSCKETKDFLTDFGVEVIWNNENVGTARAINIAMRQRKDGENFIKMDNDIVCRHKGWVDELEEAISRDGTIGILGLKRKDIWQSPLHENEAYRTTIKSLPHQAGERWINIEVCPDIMGSCTMFSSKLVETINFLYQKGSYAFDDTDYSYRSHLAGFTNAFLPHIEIDHVDAGGNEYTHWKQRVAGEVMADFNKRCEEYRTGARPLYYGGEND